MARTQLGPRVRMLVRALRGSLEIRRVFMAAALTMALAAGGYGAFLIGLNTALESRLEDGRAVPTVKREQLENYLTAIDGAATFALLSNDPTAFESALRRAQRAAQQLVRLAETSEERASAEDLESAVAFAAKSTATFETARNAALSAARTHLRRIEEARYDSLSAWSRWSGRGAALTLVGLAGLSLFAAGSAAWLERRARQAPADRSRKLDAAVTRIERSHNRYEQAAEHLRAQAHIAQHASRDLRDAASNIMDVGQAFGDGADQLLDRIEGDANMLLSSAARTSDTALDVLSSFANASDKLDAETTRLSGHNNRIDEMIASGRPAFEKAFNCFSSAAESCERSVSDTVSRMETLVAELRGDQDALADAIALVKSKIAQRAEELNESVDSIVEISTATRAALDSDIGPSGAQAVFARSADAMEEARLRLTDSVERLFGPDGAFTAAQNVQSADGNVRYLGGAAALRRADETITKLKSLSEAAGKGVAQVLARLDSVAGDIEAAARRLGSGAGAPQDDYDAIRELAASAAKLQAALEATQAPADEAASKQVA